MTEVEWKNIWKLKAHERSKIFIWKISAIWLPTKDRVSQRLGGLDTSCNLRGHEKLRLVPTYSLNMPLLTLFGLAATCIFDLIA